MSIRNALRPKRRLLVLGALAPLVFLAVALSLSGFRTMLFGWLRGEPRCHGMPTSYWRSAILNYQPGSFICYGTPPPTPSFFSYQCDRVLALFTFSDPPNIHPSKSLQEPAAVPVLVELLRDESSVVSSCAGHILADMGPQAATAAPELVKTLKDCNRPVNLRRWSAALLGKIRAQDPETISALVETLDEANQDLRFDAIQALGRIGPPARAALPALILVLKKDTLDHGSSFLCRMSAAEAIAQIDPDADEAVLLLIDLMKNQDPMLRSKAAEGIRNFRTQDPRAAQALLALLENKASHLDYVRRSAAHGLASIGPAAKDALPGLVAALDDDKVNVRMAAAMALRKVDPANKQAIPALILALNASDASNRYWICRYLGDIGPEARDAIPALTAALRDHDSNVRQGARYALEKIAPGEK